jgi:hypothetical protein
MSEVPLSTEHWVELVQDCLGRSFPTWLSGEAEVRGCLLNRCSCQSTFAKDQGMLVRRDQRACLDRSAAVVVSPI